MAPVITPGYDFGQAEVPTFARFIQQAQGLNITGFDFTDLAEDFTYIFNGQDTDGSGMTLADLEGAMWYSPLGDLWMSQRWTLGDFGTTGQSSGSEEFVRVRLFRAGGGYETAKFKNGDDSAGAGRQGAPAQVHTQDLSLQYSPANIYLEARWLNQLTQGARDFGFWHETQASGTRHEVVMRGLVIQTLEGSGGKSGDAILPFRVRSDAATAWGMIRNDTSNSRKWGVGEYVLGHPSIPFLSDPGSTDEIFMWAYGRDLHSI